MIYVQALFSAYRKSYRLSREYDQIKTTCRRVHLYTRPTEPLKSGLLVSEILLMEEILHHLGCIRPYRSWDHQIIIILGGFSGFQPSTVCFCIKNQASQVAIDWLTVFINVIFPEEQAPPASVVVMVMRSVFFLVGCKKMEVQKWSNLEIRYNSILSSHDASRKIKMEIPYQTW